MRKSQVTVYLGTTLRIARDRSHRWPFLVPQRFRDMQAPTVFRRTLECLVWPPLTERHRRLGHSERWQFWSPCQHLL